MKDRLRSFLKCRMEKNRELLLNEAREISGFMQLLMKERNTEKRWTETEKAQLKKYIRRAVAYVPLLCIFLLPGGFLLIPLLAEVIDRRKTPRTLSKAS